jgi:hypothetical protein
LALLHVAWHTLSFRRVCLDETVLVADYNHLNLVEIIPVAFVVNGLSLAGWIALKYLSMFCSCFALGFCQLEFASDCV